MANRVTNRQLISIDDVIEHFGTGKFQVGYLIAMAICECSDGIEILALSLLVYPLRCSWKITDFQGALITTMVFAGMTIGAALLSALADKFGRKPMLILAIVIGIVFGILSVFSPNIYWLYFLRGNMGIGVGGILVLASTTLAEVSPRHFRAKAQAIIFIAWSLGSLILVGIGYLILPRLGWRWFLFFVCIPLFIGIIPVALNSESIRFLVYNGQYEKAMEVVRRMSKYNQRPMPNHPIDMRLGSQGKQSVSLKRLFDSEFRLLTVLQMIVWILAGLLYYGAVIFSVSLPTITYSCLQNSSEYFMNELKIDDDSCCKQLTSSVYISLAVASLGDLASCLVDAYILDFFGRKIGLTICAGFSAAAFFVLNFCMPVVARDLMMLVMRCFTLAFVDGLYVLTTELYPTNIRSTGIGFCQAFSRIGGLITPFFAQVLVKKNTRLTLFIYAGLSVLAGAATMLIPRETLNESMTEDLDLDVEHFPLKANAFDDKALNYNTMELTNKDK